MPAWSRALRGAEPWERALRLGGWLPTEGDGRFRYGRARRPARLSLWRWATTAEGLGDCTHALHTEREMWVCVCVCMRV